MESLIEGTVALLPAPPLSAQCQAGFSKTWVSVLLTLGKVSHLVMTLSFLT